MSKKPTKEKIKANKETIDGMAFAVASKASGVVNGSRRRQLAEHYRHWYKKLEREGTPRHRYTEPHGRKYQARLAKAQGSK